MDLAVECKKRRGLRKRNEVRHTSPMSYDILKNYKVKTFAFINHSQ